MAKSTSEPKAKSIAPGYGVNPSAVICGRFTMRVRASGLVDTGAILALLDRNDRWHRRCVEAFATLRLPLATSAAVLAELFHLVGDNR